MIARYAYSALYVDDLGRLNRVLTSAVHLDLETAARAAELSEPPERGIDWLPAILDRDDWLIGISLNHSPSTASAAYLAPRLVHPASATEHEIRQVWARTRTSTTFLAEVNEYRAERGLQQGTTPRFDLTPAQPTTYIRQ
ncbi:hypothetical protein QBL07_017925 [Gordonia rubripertincta]|uniref:Uncharacterized protein n=1 Tax=Gordonia rubripertincta TaxID=36822 RepID=A0AAW6R573_GORRU|nr:hypothetical protein [Gordonia rubripertincta]MDG6779591.1 hypothetical protein [Gordonia rubripertincta]NKY62897.1 hypothetical protein [Gordonia rubripertincta]